MEHTNMPPALLHPENEAVPVSPTPLKVGLFALLCAFFCSALLYPTLHRDFFIDPFLGDITLPVAFGVNIPLCVLAVYLAFALSLRGQQEIRWKNGWLLFPVIGLLAASFALFNVPDLHIANLLALCALIPLHLALLSGNALFSLPRMAFPRQLGEEILLRPFRHIFAALRSVFAGAKMQSRKHLLYGLAGAIVCLPALAAVIFLLGKADLRFADLFGSFYDTFFSDQIVVIAAVGLLLFFPALGILYSHRERRNFTANDKKGLLEDKVPSPAIYTALILFNIVLALFAVLQFERILNPIRSEAVHYARSAHESFFPMLYAAIICFIVQCRASACISSSHRAAQSCSGP